MSKHNSERPYLDDRELRDRLRREQPWREVWVEDGPEEYSGEKPRPEEVTTAPLCIGYENFYDRPILPSTVMADAIDYFRAYSLARSLKDAEDAAGALHNRANPPHVQEFLRQSLELIEEVHALGLHSGQLLGVVEEELTVLIQAGIRLNNQAQYSSNSQLCTAIWQEVLAARMEMYEKFTK